MLSLQHTHMLIHTFKKSPRKMEYKQSAALLL